MEVPTSDKPIVAITLGDAAGVGPEVIAGAWASPEVHACCRPFVVGHGTVLKRAVDLVGGPRKVVPFAARDEMRDRLDSDDPRLRIPCLSACLDDICDVPPGRVDARTGHGAFDAISTAVELALTDQVDAIVTAPICKEAMHRAGHIYPGHTELLAEMCGTREFAMMLYHPPGKAVRGLAGLGIVHVTLHMALRDVFSHMNVAAIREKCRLADRAMKDFGVSRPRIGVFALNPHAGEYGLFGDEEQRILGPAVALAREDGLDVTGPVAADALVPAARDGALDVLVAMYHDQGHIALKLLGPFRAVNVTLGLPIVRTSVAHGTAFDRAWQGKADSRGMVTAITTAARLARTRAIEGGKNEAASQRRS